MGITRKPNEPDRPQDVEFHGLYRAGALLSLLRLHWFIKLRWVILTAAFTTLLAERLLIPETPRAPQVAVLLAVLAVVNLIWMGVSRFLYSRLGDLTEEEEANAVRSALVFANVQVAVDLLMLTLILRYTGGVENPMAVFYLFHTAIVSLVLRSRQALAQALWAVLLYAVMGVGELLRWFEPHYPLLRSMRGLGLHNNPEYVLAAIAIVASGVLGMLYFTLRIAGRLDDREQQLRHVLEALRKSQAAIADLQRRRSRFMQTAAHQLKTPLAVVQTLAGLIRDDVVQGEAMRDTCKKIIFRCQEGIAQVTELLTLGRLQEVDPGRQSEVVTDVGRVVVDLCRQYEPLAAAKDLQFLPSIPLDLDLTALLDAKDLKDCVGNLIDNAIKFSFGPGKVWVTVGRIGLEGPQRIQVGDRPITISSTNSEDCVFISVADTGMGIDPAMFSGPEGPGGEGSIFDAFRRGNPALAAKIPGTGLGLSIVREIVEQAGGEIHVHSQPGKGSTFTVMVPTRRSTPAVLAVRNTRSSRIIIETDGEPGADLPAPPEVKAALK